MKNKYKLYVSDDDMVNEIQGTYHSLVRYLNDKNYKMLGTRDERILLHCDTEDTTAVIFYGNISNTTAVSVVSELHQSKFERQFADTNFRKVLVLGSNMIAFIDEDNRMLRVTSLDEERVLTASFEELTNKSKSIFTYQEARSSLMNYVNKLRAIKSKERIDEEQKNNTL